MLALTLGLVAGNLVKPGAGFDAHVVRAGARRRRRRSPRPRAQASGLIGFITDDLLPTSFVQPFVENEILRVLVIAILAARRSPSLAAQRERVVAVFEDDLEDPLRRSSG